MNVIVHVDEIFLKGKNQGLFVKKLADNIRRLFKAVSVKRIEGGFIISGLSAQDISRLALVPGIAKFSPVIESERDIKSIKKCLDNLIIESGVKTFRISAARADKNYCMNSEQINRELGAYVESTKKLKVNLKNFDIDIRIDIGKNRAYLYAAMKDGIGGLPTGSSGKVLCLLSGGIDSPVAAYEMMKRGAEVILIHFQNALTASENSLEKITDITKMLANYQPKISLYVVPFDIFQREIIMKIPAVYRMIANRRTMFRIAECFARKLHCGALVTGDSLGQVASQTLTNLSVIYSAVQILKVAPLISRNKSEIVKISRHIGTLEISNRPYPDCCSYLVAKHPQTAAKNEKISELENSLVFPELDKIKSISYHISIN